MNVNIKLLNH